MFNKQPELVKMKKFIVVFQVETKDLANVYARLSNVKESSDFSILDVIQAEGFEMLDVREFNPEGKK